MSETDQRLEQLFHECDIDGSGYIGEDEVMIFPQNFHFHQRSNARVLLSQVRELCGLFGASESDAKEIFQKLDRDGDGRVR